jgi:hypothetical protein
MGWWNTECRLVCNFTAATIFEITDLEANQSTTSRLRVYPGTCGDLKLYFPWCANDTEVRTKGLRFSADTGEPFFMFQSWPSNIICWTPNNRGDPRFMAAMPVLAAPTSRVNVIIDPSRVPTAHEA